MLTILSWNTLTNNLPGSKISPQSTRIESILDDINGFSPDIAGLYELDSRLAADIPQRIGHQQAVIAAYERPKYGLSMTLSSNLPMNNTGVIEYTAIDKRKAVSGTIDDIRVVATHLSYKLSGFSLRTAQIRDILADIGDSEQAIVMGDFNCMPWQKPRRLLKAAGFVSVASQLTPKNPTTFPTPGFKKLLRVLQQIITFKGLQIDDIYLKNLEFVEGGIIEGQSDHFGIWATIKN